MAPDKKGPKTDDAFVTRNVSNFLQRMFDPSITRALESRMPSMSTDLLHVPWTLINDNETDANANGDDKTCAVYPSFSYLDLRRIQNTQWATERLKEGIRLQKDNSLIKAEACYKEGIALVPTHAELFVAYGSLCANVGRTGEAIQKLQHALELQPDVPNAQHFLDVIQKQQAPMRQAGSVIRSETAMKDALMERSFFQGRTKALNANDEKYPLVHEDKDPVDRGEKKHRKKSSKRRHRAEKSRKKRKRRERSGITSDESSVRGRRRRRHRRTSSEETSEEFSRKRHGRQRHGGASSVETSDESSHCTRRRRKRDHRRDSSEETSEESSRRRRRRRNSRRHDSCSSSDSSRARYRRKAKRRKRREK
jgi:hypothetical protein